MNKLGELVAAKEIDPSKPILEQPGGPAQKFIKELIRDEEVSQRLITVMSRAALFTS